MALMDQLERLAVALREVDRLPSDNPGRHLIRHALDEAKDQLRREIARRMQRHETEPVRRKR